MTGFQQLGAFEFEVRFDVKSVCVSIAPGPDWTAAQRYLALGLHLSFSGVLTFKTADAVRDAAARAPLERLLVETDCPFLTPVPFRGKRNEPAHVALTAARLAGLRGVPLAAVEQATTANARRVLRLPE